VKTVLAPGKCKTVLRASTSRETIGGPLVQKALAFIARNAKNGIGARDVVAHLKVSRALVDLRFREVRGVSLLNTILDVRLAELKRMLRETDDPIESITRRLGWSSPNYPKNLFKKRTGMSMQAYRMSSR
jgi:LacI family transcriptional regulator